jgi:NADH-quinone oxidoreductase subunit L
MNDWNSQVITALGIVTILAPFSLTVLIGVSSLIGRRLDERTISRAVPIAVLLGLAASVMVLIWMLASGTRHVAIELGDWVDIPHYFRFSIKFVFDRLSVPMTIITFTLSGTIAAFASKYLHREPGFNRFFSLYSVFLLGLVIASLSGTIETLFTGWELVGLSSALLVAYFQERPAPARNALWIWIVYRISDAALLLAAVVLHHLKGEGDFDKLIGSALPWPDGQPTLSQGQALVVGLLILLAAAGKSGLIPFSGWLPRAMEGPTPSSAVFYGALSVHLGAYLLLRFSPVLESSLVLQILVVVLGLGTAVLAYLTGSVQTDIKSVLAYASLTQVGIITAEIGCGLRYIALIHLLGHACLRTLQFLRAPTLLRDYHTLENAIGGHLPRGRTPFFRLVTRRSHPWFYRFGLEKSYLDAFLVELVVRPYIRIFRWCDTMERRWTDFLAGGDSRESDQVKPHFGTIEEFR